MAETFSHPTEAAAPLGFVLLDAAAPDVDALEAALREELGEAVTRFTSGGGDTGRPETPTLAIQTNGSTVLVAPAAVPVPHDQALRACHPAFWADTAPVAGHRSHLVITVFREPDAVVDRERVLNDVVTHSLVATIALEQPGAVAFFSGNAGATFPGELYHRLVVDCLEDGRLPVEGWVSAWLMAAEESGVSGYTVGMDTFGHADFLVQDSARAPEQVHAVLMGLAQHVVATGEGLDPGDQVAGPEGEPYPVSATYSEPHEAWLLRVGC